MSVRQKSKGNDILLAATTVFCQKGYHNATIINIAEAAGVGKGTVYEYFSSKDDLFIQMIKFNLERYIHDLRIYINKCEGFNNKLIKFIEFHIGIIENKLELSNLFISNIGLSLNSEIKNRMWSIIKGLRKDVGIIILDIVSEGVIEGIVKDDIGEFEADIFYEMVIRYCIRSAFDCSIIEIQRSEDMDRLIRMFLKGISI